MELRERIDRLSQQVLAPGAAAYLGKRLSRRLAALGSPPVLDVGCGYGSPLPDPHRRMIGIDRDEQRARARASHAATAVADAAALPFADGHFAASISIGLLHHLDNDAARRAIGEMMRVVRPGGRVVIFDAVLPASARRRPLAAMIRALDRGNAMRTEAELRGLFRGISDWRFKRVTYAATGLEGLWCVGVTPAAGA